MKASSPDEVALVNFAKYCDIEFTGVDENNDIIIRENNKMLKFKILHVFEFDSTRYIIRLAAVVLKISHKERECQSLLKIQIIN